MFRNRKRTKNDRCPRETGTLHDKSNSARERGGGTNVQRGVSSVAMKLPCNEPHLRVSERNDVRFSVEFSRWNFARVVAARVRQRRMRKGVGRERAIETENERNEEGGGAMCRFRIAFVGNGVS